MRIRKNALLLFSKYPEPGMVKTRLSVLKDGAFTAEDAALLYKAMLLDVVNVCNEAFRRMERDGAAAAEVAAAVSTSNKDVVKSALDAAFATADGVLDVYKLFISVAPEQDVTRMRTLIEEELGDSAASKIAFISDSGASFDDHYNDAFEQVWEEGADCILSMGADMPALTVYDVARGFMALHALGDEDSGGIALAPDQEMGVSIVGWTRDTDFDHTGVFYNKDGLTVLPAYIQKARRAGIPAIYLPPVPDVDTMADLAHNVTLADALSYCSEYDGNVAPKNTLKALSKLGITEVRVPANDLHDPREAIDC